MIIHNKEERRARLIEAVVAIIIVCLIALAFYEYGRMYAIEKVTKEYERSFLERESPVHYPYCMTTPLDELPAELPVPY